MPAGDPIKIKVRNAAALRLFVYVYDRSHGAGAAPVFADFLEPAGETGDTSDHIEIEADSTNKYSIRWLSQAYGHADLAKSLPVADGQTYDVTAGA